MVVPMVGGGDAHPRAGVLVDAVAKRGSNRERSFAAGNERSIGLKEGLTATRILLAEDDQILGSGLKAGLGQAGFQVDWVRDGQAAQNKSKTKNTMLSSSISAYRSKTGLTCFARRASGGKPCRCWC